MVGPCYDKGINTYYFSDFPSKVKGYFYKRETGKTNGRLFCTMRGLLSRLVARRLDEDAVQ